MDESKPRRRWLSFTIRDLLWAMAVVGLAVGWWIDSRQAEDRHHCSIDLQIELANDLQVAKAGISNSGFQVSHEPQPKLVRVSLEDE